ncbi:MAG TPA: oxidoreductase [Bacteroidales bacterium]|nr:oxidoreductase [Bacteroidales bacterium]
MKHTGFVPIIILMCISSCNTGNNEKAEQMDTIKLMTVDPGHFHAALVQKSMYDNVSPEAYVYAPGGNDLDLHLDRIKAFNNRENNPTSWIENTYAGDNFFEEMIEKRPGNVVVLAGSNNKKTDYILKSVTAGLNVLADKPMVITPDKFPLLEKAFEAAREKNVLLYDIMTERYEITTMLQKALSQKADLFGSLVKGSAEEPAVTKESTHHFFKYVSGSALVRPPWFFDTNQQGEGIVDVTTHLVDLIQWECYPEIILNKSDIEIISARRWPTILSKDDFKKVTGLEEFPPYLEKYNIDGNIQVYANGEIIYKIKDTWAKVVVEWKYMAPEGTGDTHYSIMRGSKCDLFIRQGKDENYRPALYLRTHTNEIDTDFINTIVHDLPWKGITVESVGDMIWKFSIPDEYRAGHEAHFSQVTEKYIEYLEKGNMPEWEVPNMIVKYYTTMEALKKALE